LEIRKEKRPFKGPYRIPYADAGGKMKPFLKQEFNIESDSREILDKAREIVGEEKNPVFATLKIMDWVYENIEKKPVVSVPSALEVLRTRVGDCNEHATLLTALLRAAGIPARLNIGLVYTRGKFFYHAWTEAYLGRWVSMDATTNQMPADVTHIKLIEGNLDKQVEIAGLIGQLKLKILDYE
ncbi:MAG: transglutaminase domain-containing protein, partial [Deltaproteobacteria bacterium]|nr:transglutaminase domain-containing protein [Deltaproteobacteria bacterium]